MLIKHRWWRLWGWKRLWRWRRWQKWRWSWKCGQDCLGLHDIGLGLSDIWLQIFHILHGLPDIYQDCKIIGQDCLMGHQLEVGAHWAPWLLVWAYLPSGLCHSLSCNFFTRNTSFARSAIFTRVSRINEFARFTRSSKSLDSPESYDDEDGEDDEDD